MSVMDHLRSKERREIDMYGCTVETMRRRIEASLDFKFVGPAMTAMSLMSNAQEEIEYGMKEEARKSLNQAKWILSTYMMERR